MVNYILKQQSFQNPSYEFSMLISLLCSGIKIAQDCGWLLCITPFKRTWSSSKSRQKKLCGMWILTKIFLVHSFIHRFDKQSRNANNIKTKKNLKKNKEKKKRKISKILSIAILQVKLHRYFEILIQWDLFIFLIHSLSNKYKKE